jgi:hypothetical protein
VDRLNARLLAILTQRGISARDYVIKDDAEGKRIYLAAWNTATLGPRPTLEELRAIPETDIETQDRTATIDRETASTLVKAILLYYLRDKLARNPTAAERQAAMAAFKQAYKDVA